MVYPYFLNKLRDKHHNLPVKYLIEPQISSTMGKGDKKTRKGKIAKGSFGVSRPRKKKTAPVKKTKKS